MNIELVKSDIKDALLTSFLLGTIESGIKSGPGGASAYVALETLKSNVERKVTGIVEDMRHSYKGVEMRLAEEEMILTACLLRA